MPGLTWSVPKLLVARTVGALSSKRAEVFALWTSPLDAPPGRRIVTRVIVPEQESRSGDSGAYVHVHGKELRRIAFDNYERGERSAAQLHTHPSGDTRMSALDREWEVVARPGDLSIIVPDYCRGGLESFRRASVYEREQGGRWRPWCAGELEGRIRPE